ncbi:MAG TPA: hypothetical protein VGD22_04580 [Sphingobacteriaceae bacterium]
MNTLRLLLAVLLIFFASVAGAEVLLPAGRVIYIIANPKTNLEKHITDYLTNYLNQVLKKSPIVVPDMSAVPANSPAILLSSQNQKALFGVSAPVASPECFALKTVVSASHKLIIALGNTDKGLKRAVQKLIIKSEQQKQGLIIPELNLSESPWIQKREWTLCGWAPELVRGVYKNVDADKRLNVWLYGDQQIANYVDMFDWFGFSGVQLMETASLYGVMGSREAVQDRLKKFALSAKDNGQDVSMWVWAAQFNNYGWFDKDVTYIPEKGKTAFEDSKVRASFEKYYEGYAELAPYVDLLITHFYDPGQLKDRSDVFNYMRLLFGKFRAKNPKVKLGVDFWASDSDSAYMKQLIDNGFTDALLMESSMPHLYPPGKREALHERARSHNLEMGVWGWHTAEIETDQNPNMHVNAKLLSNFYKQVKNGAHKIHPITYWSEMEAYHLNNIFTMYSAGQLLWNPERDPDQILREIAEGIYGPVNGPEVLKALHLIQDVRTGPSWDTYWIWLPTHRLGTADPKEDLKRADAAIAAFETMKTDANYVPKIPLPFPPATFIELTLPHLRQIRHFADFRIKLAELEKKAQNGASKEELTSAIGKIWDPVRDYGNWVGTFGPLEARTQEKMLVDFSRKYGVEIKAPGWMRFRDANRLLQALQNRQRKFAEPVRFKPEISWGEFLWTKEKGLDRFHILIDNEVVRKAGDNLYELVNWEEYRLR